MNRETVQMRLWLLEGRKGKSVRGIKFECHGASLHRILTMEHAPIMLVCGGASIAPASRLRYGTRALAQWIRRDSKRGGSKSAETRS